MKKFILISELRRTRLLLTSEMTFSHEKHLHLLNSEFARPFISWPNRLRCWRDPITDFPSHMGYAGALGYLTLNHFIHSEHTWSTVWEQIQIWPLTHSHIPLWWFGFGEHDTHARRRVWVSGKPDVRGEETLAVFILWFLTGSFYWFGETGNTQTH